MGDATARAYRRGDAVEKRRKLMEAWVEFLDRKARVANLLDFANLAT